MSTGKGPRGSGTSKDPRWQGGAWCKALVGRRRSRLSVCLLTPAVYQAREIVVSKVVMDTAPGPQRLRGVERQTEAGSKWPQCPVGCGLHLKPRRAVYNEPVAWETGPARVRLALPDWHSISAGNNRSLSSFFKPFLRLELICHLEFNSFNL